jgi:flagellar hook-associated protein 3 FlgL
MTINPSSFSASYSLQRTIQTLRNELIARQNEIATGRKSDLAGTLGSQIRRSMNLHTLSGNLKSYIGNNNIIQSRLDITKSSLSNIAENTQEFKTSLLLAQNDARGQNLLVVQARNFLKLLISTMNNSFDNTYIFAGEKTNAKPLNDFYSTPVSAAKSAINDAFLNNPPDGFGFSQTSPLVSSITPEQISSFIDGPLSSLFSADEWSRTWSNAGARPLKCKISPIQTLEASVTSNDPALHKIAMAYVMVCELGAENMNSNSYQTLMRRATDLLDEGIKLLNTTRTGVGVMQQNIEKANSSLNKQLLILDIQLSSLEGADQADTAAITNSILNQLEASYTLTSRVSRLSLVNYI